MKAMRKTSSRYLVSLLGVTIAMVIWLTAGPAVAQFCSGGGVCLSPPGGSLSGALVSGTKATLTLGSLTESCVGATLQGTLPGSCSDPATVPLNPSPTFSSCTAAGASTSMTTSGTWSLDFSCDGHAVLHVPSGGLVTNVLGCTITIGHADLPGTYDPQTGTICFGNEVLPILQKQGLFCPAGSTVTFSACYAIPGVTITQGS